MFEHASRTSSDYSFCNDDEWTSISGHHHRPGIRPRVSSVERVAWLLIQSGTRDLPGRVSLNSLVCLRALITHIYCNLIRRLKHIDIFNDSRNACQRRLCTTSRAAIGRREWTDGGRHATARTATDEIYAKSATKWNLRAATVDADPFVSPVDLGLDTAKFHKQFGHSGISDQHDVTLPRTSGVIYVLVLMRRTSTRWQSGIP